MNILQALEQQIVDAHPTKDRAVAFHLCNELRMIDYGHVADRELDNIDTRQLLPAIAEIIDRLPVAVPVKQRAQQLFHALNAIWSVSEPL